MKLLLVAVAGFCFATPYCSAQEPKERANWDAHGEVLYMAITEDGQALASGTWDRITLWNVANGKDLHTLKGHDREVRCVAFSPDAKVLASGGEQRRNGKALGRGHGQGPSHHSSSKRPEVESSSFGGIPA